MGRRPDGDLKRSRREPRISGQLVSRPRRRRRRQMRQWRGALIICAAIAACLVLLGHFAGPHRQSTVAEHANPASSTGP
jgi:ferric-dicitrate binding protein FerR (iron transport regulator)